jgi:hypothetical protein
MATLRKITLNWEIRTGAITCDTGYIKRQELCDVDLYVTVDGTAYALDTSWALNLSVKPALLGDNAALVAVTTWTASATTGLYQATAQTIGGTALDTYLAANNSDTTDDEGNKLVDLDVYYTVSTAKKATSDTVTVICKPDVGRADDTVPATIIARNDFLVSNGTGLLVNVAAGYAANGAFVAAQSSLAITNATNYIEVTAAGVASVNTTAFSAGSYPLATVVASAGAITANTDLRAWITPKPSADELPSQTGNSGKYLTTNGTATSWATVTGGVTSITGTANEITVTGTTTPTLSLPSALTFTGKTVTGGTFNAAQLRADTTSENAVTGESSADGTGVVGLTVSGVAFSGSASGGGTAFSGYSASGKLLSLSGNDGENVVIANNGQLTLGKGASGTIVLKGSTSGSATITASATGVLALPSGTTATNMALTTPNLGTPSAIVLTNASGTAASLTAGNVTTNANLTGHVTSVGNAAVLGSFTMAQLSTAVSDGDPAYVGAANAFTAANSLTLAPAANTVATGWLLTDTTAATSGNQQYSPAIRWTGQGWKTTATAASQAVDVRAYLVPVQGTTAPSATLTYDYSINGGAFSNLFTVSTGGTMILPTTSNLQVQSITGPSGSATLTLSGAGGSDTVVNVGKFRSGNQGAATAQLESQTTGEHLRLRYDASNYTSFTTSSAGLLAIDGGGASKGVSVANTLAVSGATTLTGLLTANGGITLGDAQNIAFNTTTGTKIGAATTQKLSFWNATPIVQPTTAVASATVASPGGGTNLKTDDTFDGYTIAQVVKALRNAGLLA